MLLIIGTVRIPAGSIEKARPALKRLVEASRAEDGCVEYGYAEDVLDSGLLHIKEVWTSQAALDLHFTTAHIAQWRAEAPALGVGDRNLLIYDIGEPRPLIPMPAATSVSSQPAAS